MKQSITGRDGYLVGRALGYAIECIERQPLKWQERSDKDDMILLLDHLVGPEKANWYRLQARSHIEHRPITDYIVMNEA